jgi:3-hydroxy acid dehydrogenase / malonic semialdehyde reductase
MTKTALITGASSGIGYQTAKVLAELGFQLIISGRRKERLHELQAALKPTPVHVLVFDVRSKQAVEEALASLPEDFKQVDLLVNNAGNAHGLSAIQDGDTDDWDNMIDLNVKGLLYLTRALSPQMVARKSGQIINVGSIAGKEVYANGNVYCATKHAVDALTRGMLIDLNPFGIKVGSINPGMVETEFSVVRFKGDEDKAKKVYEGLQPLTPLDVANAIGYMATLPPHVNISDLTILPTAQAAATVVKRG